MWIFFGLILFLELERLHCEIRQYQLVVCGQC